MTNETQAKPKVPTWKQAMILVGAGIVLSAGGCATWFEFVFHESEHWLPLIGAVAFFVGLPLVIAGVLRAGHIIQTWKQALVLQTIGAALAISGFWGVMAASQWGTAPAWVLFIAAPASVVGVVLFLVGLVGAMTLSRKMKINRR
jgi:hypothetical protein